MSLKEFIVQKKPREISGPRSANRFDFQKSWALCRLLELQRSGQDYLIVFDFHDDVLVLDSSMDPKRIEFYQIKTKQSGHWTRTALLAREQGKDGPLPSILGKLIGNKLDFAEYTSKLTLVSTQGFKLAVTGRAESIVQDVCFKELEVTDLAAILKAIRDEHSLGQDPDCKECTHLTVTSLSLADHGNHAMGILGQFLEQLYPGQKVPLPAIYRTLCDEIKRKTNVETLPVDFADLCAHRSISKDAFEKILRDVRPSDHFDASVAEAMTQLQHEGCPFDAVRQIRTSCTTYEIERMDSSNLVLMKAREVVEEAVKKLRDENGIPPKLMDAIAVVAQAVKSKTELLGSMRSDHYRTAMILVALYGI